MLKSKTKDEILKFIRLIKNGYNFNMSGYEAATGECTVRNIALLNMFSDLGIYDYTHYLFLDFHKGIGIIYYKYWNSSENLHLDVSGLGTTDIIYEIFKLTILSGKTERKRL